MSLSSIFSSSIPSNVVQCFTASSNVQMSHCTSVLTQLSHLAMHEYQVMSGSESSYLNSRTGHGLCYMTSDTFHGSMYFHWIQSHSIPVYPQTLIQCCLVISTQLYLLQDSQLSATLSVHQDGSPVSRIRFTKVLKMCILAYGLDLSLYTSQSLHMGELHWQLRLVFPTHYSKDGMLAFY